MNRNFADRKSKVKLPMEEIRKPYRESLGGLDRVTCHSTSSLPDQPAQAVGEGEGKVKEALEGEKGTKGEGLDDGGDLMMVRSVAAGADTVGPGSIDNAVLKHFDYWRKTNDWDRLIRNTGYLFQWLASVQFGEGQSSDMLAKEMSVIFWMRVAMPATNRAAVQGKLKHLSPMKHSRYPDMLVVVGRAAPGLQSLFQKEYLPSSCLQLGQHG